jgi:hypothetical protein
VDLAGARIQTISLPENVEAHEMLVADELVHVFAKKLRFRSNGMEVAVTNRTYDVHSGDLRHVFEETFDASVSADAIRLDGPRNRLLLGLEKGGIAVMDLASKQHRWLTRSRPSEITLTHFDREGDFSIVTWTKGAGVFVRSLLRADCRVLEGSQAFNAESVHINENSLVKSLDGRLLAGVDGVESVYIWNLATGALWCRIEAFTKDDWLLDDTPPIAFSDDGQFLVVFHQTDLATLAGHAECFRIERRTADALSVDRPVGTFDFGEPRPVGSIRIGKHAQIVWLRASASEPWLAFARSDVQGTPSGDEDEPATRADGFSAELIGDDSVAVAFSPAGHRMALVRFDGTIEVWEAAASSAAWSFSCERIVRVLQESTPEMNRMARRPVNFQVRDDGLVAVSVRSMVRYTFYEHSGAEIAEYVLLPDGEWIARGVAGWACSPRAFDFGPCSSETRILTRAEVEQELGAPSERALEMSFRR